MGHGHGRHGGHRRHGERRRDPRVARTRAVVLETARKLLVEEGADSVTALRISEETGIARTTIYRHWPEREDLLRDTLTLEEAEPPIELTGDLRRDLIVILTSMGEQIGKPRGARMMSVSLDRSGLRGEAGGPHREMMKRRLNPLRRAIEAGIDSGELPVGLDVDGAIANLAGPSFFQAVFFRQKPSTVLVEEVVDSFLATHSN